MQNVINCTPKATFYVNELACEIAELFIMTKYEGQNVPLYDINEDEDDHGNMRYTLKIQDEFNSVVERIESLLNESKL